MRTKQEIETEIVALKALRPIGRFAAKTACGISLQIEELESGIDQTCDEWDVIPDEHQSVVRDTVAWREGQYGIAPSMGWDGLVE